MSFYHYIVSDRELPTGAFGKKKTVMTIMEYITHVKPEAKNDQFMQVLLEKDPEGKQLMDIYDTEYDAAGLYISGPIDDEGAVQLFRHPLVYQISPEGGSFGIDEETKRRHPDFYERSLKCLNELFAYLDSNMESGDEVELYACWTDHVKRFEELPLEEMELDLSSFRLRDGFQWKERQLIRVKK